MKLKWTVAVCCWLLLCASIAVAEPAFVSPLAAAAGDQVNGTVSGRWAVWVDRRSVENSGDIYGRDLLTGQEFPIAVGPEFQASPDIDGNTVVWMESLDDPPRRNLWGCTLTPPVTPSGPVGVDPFLIRPFPTPEAAGGPRISGDTVVYGRSVEYEWDSIYGYSLSRQEEFPICVDMPGEWASPDICGDIVVWHDTRNAEPTEDEITLRNFDIYGYDLHTREEFAICTAPGLQVRPRVSTTAVVWCDGRKGDLLDLDIYGWNLARHQEFPVAVGPGSQGSPDISAGMIVWIDIQWSTHPELPNEVEVHAYDLATGETTTLATDADPYTQPTIVERLVWDAGVASRTADRDVFCLVEFADIPVQHWAFGAVEACARADVVRGYGDGTYLPDAPISRDQMAVFVARALAGGDELVPSAPSMPSFFDVLPHHWAYKYVECAVAQNVVAGYPNGLYRPAESVDRGQMAVFVARALVAPAGDSGIPTASPEPTFPDVTSDNEWSWCYDHVEHIAAQGVALGYEDGLYHPEYICTRGQMAVYLARAFGLGL